MKNICIGFKHALLVVVLLGAGMSSGYLNGQSAHQVAVRNNSFTPKELTVIAGDTVVWKNTQGVHNVNGNKAVFPNNPSSFGNNPGSNWTYSFVFMIPGVYNYHCDPHVDFGMTGKVTVLSDPNKLTFNLAFTGMNPHVGQTLWLSVLDSGSGEEVARTRAEVRQAFDIKVQNLKQGHSYLVDFYADHNGNGRYDVPPVDHAWRLEVNSLTGDTQLNFAHNTSFTDISWKNRLTVDFAGMTPHIGQKLTFYVKESVSGLYQDTLLIDQIPGAAFQVLSYMIVPGKSYFLDFYADHNKNGQYDAPPADHAWRMDLANVAGDTALTFLHNTSFTDIFHGTSGISNETVLQDVEIFPNPANSKIAVAFKNTGNSGLTVSILNIAGMQMMSGLFPAGRELIEIEVGEFPSGLYFITLLSGKDLVTRKFIRE